MGRSVLVCSYALADGISEILCRVGKGLWVGNIKDPPAPKSPFSKMGKLQKFFKLTRELEEVYNRPNSFEQMGHPVQARMWKEKDRGYQVIRW